MNSVFKYLGYLAVVLCALTFPGASLAQSKTVNGITISDVSIPQAQRGVFYTYDIAATTSAPTAGDAPYTFTIIGQNLPNGIVLSPEGVVSGVNCDSKNGTFPFDLRVTSASGTVADFIGNVGTAINMTVGPAGGCDLTLSLPGGGAVWPVNTAYSQTLGHDLPDAEQLREPYRQCLLRLPSDLPSEVAAAGEIRRRVISRPG